MRLQQYLNERTYYLDDMDEIVKILKKDCKQYINDIQRYYNRNFLLSGRKSKAFFDKRKVRKDRVPRDTPKEIHEVIDDWFYDEFGIRYRSNSFFAGFSRSLILAYGCPYIMFPVGKYTAVSSPNIKDLFEAIEENINNETNGRLGDLKYGGDEYADNYDLDTIYNSIENMMDDAGYKDIRKGYIKNNEIMVNCKEYYILSKKTIDMDVGEGELLQKLIN